ncbi:MAG TPA: hypothetical protein VFM70_10065 [Salinimicrobium sp.]|nr:hypothetical protein [Salinimicrobium sp.]
MKQDIEIPSVEKVYVAAIYEWNDEFRVHDWNAYIINENNFALETILVVSRGFDSKRTTSTMRHSVKVLPAKSYAKIELLQPEILKLNNEFSVSFFAEGKLLHKKFLFPKNSIKESNLKEIPVVLQQGILAK